jgi:phosphatidylglycerol:prolipoprotein diacylglycerol transferase
MPKDSAFALYVMLYSLARFGLEFLRGDYAEKVLGFMTSAQTTSFFAFLIAGAFFIGLGIHQRRQIAQKQN